MSSTSSTRSWGLSIELIALAAPLYDEEIHTYLLAGLQVEYDPSVTP
jgi:hypothetical protein